MLHTNLKKMKNTKTPTNIFKAYVNNSCSLPKLSKDEEHRLIKQYQEGDAKALDALLASHVASIYYLASKYTAPDMPIEDLFNESVLAFIKGVSNFDLSKNLRLTTYCVRLIKHNLYKYYQNHKAPIKLWSNKKESKVYSLEKKLKGEQSESVRIEKIHKATGYSRQIIRKAIERKGMCFASFDGVVDDYTQPTSDQSASEYDAALKQQWLSGHLHILNDTELRCIEMRFLTVEPAKYKDIASELGISTQRVEQILKKAINKLKSKAKHEGFEEAACA